MRQLSKKTHDAKIGVLRAIGASGGAILGMVQLEGLTIALLGRLLSLPLSLPVSVLLGQAFGRIMFAAPTSLTPELGGALRWLGLVSAVSLPVVKALQYE